MTKIALEIQLVNYKQNVPDVPAPIINIDRNSIDFEDQSAGTVGDSETLIVSGSNLTGNIVLAAPAGFIINLNGSDINASPITLIRSSGIVPPTNVYIKFAPITETFYTGNLTVISSGATQKNVALSGQALEEVEYEYVVEPLNLSPGFSERDGLAINEIPTGVLRMDGGWDGNMDPTSKNEVWKTLNGHDWAKDSDNAPFAPRHTFGNGVRRDGKLWIWLGDDQLVPGTAQKDVWTWDPTGNVYNLITTDAGTVVGNRWRFSHCVFDDGVRDFIYAIGGTVNNVVRSENGIDWEEVCELPDGLSVTDGFACQHGSDIIVCNGQLGKLFKLVNGTTIESLPDLTGTMVNSSFPELRSYWGKLFYVEGSGVSGNKTGVHVSHDSGQTWSKLSSFPLRARHAAGFNKYSSLDSLIIAAGNGSPDVSRLYRIESAPLSDKFAFSVFKMNDYTGSCMRVRRSSDSTELDIGFDVTGKLDTAALLAFSNSGSCFVKVWYDQSGNGNDLVNANAAQQPRIVNAGSIEVDNGLPAINFDSTTKHLQFSGIINLETNYILSMVLNFNAGDRIFGMGADGNEYAIFNYISGGITYHNNGNPTDPFTMEISPSGNLIQGHQGLVEIYRSRMTMQFFENAVLRECLPSNSPAGIPSYRDSDFHISAIGSEGGGSSFTGKIQHFICKTGVIKGDDHESIQEEINSLFEIY